MWLVDYLTNRTVTVQFQGKKSKGNHLKKWHTTRTRKQYESNTIQHGDQSTTTIEPGSKVQMTAYAYDLAIHGRPIAHDILYKQMTTALKKIETKAMQLGCCLPTPMTLASGGSPMFPLVVHQPASPSIWPAVQSLRRGLSTNPGVTMWCTCGCS